MNHIDKVGFEIEGGWEGPKFLNPIKGAQLIPDNSINGQTLGDALPIKAPHIGEAVSKPIPFDGAWREWLMENWPNADPKNRTNRTCGYHVHLSTKLPKDYMLLTAKSFLFGVLKQMMRTGEELKLHSRHVFWERMQGYNQFCRTDFDAAQQMEITNERRHGNRARYGILNFSLKAHGTMEMRALPTFRDAKIAVRFTQDYLDYVNSYLDEVASQPIEYSAKLSA